MSFSHLKVYRESCSHGTLMLGILGMQNLLISSLNFFWTDEYTLEPSPPP